MKKIVLLFILAGSIFACTKKEDGAAASADANGQSGVTFDSTANTDLYKKSLKAIESGDTAAYRSTYAPDVVFHDNLDSMSLDANMAMFKSFADKGIKVKVEFGPIWETQNNKANEKGITNYVSGYMTLTLTRGDKTAKTLIHTIDAVKDGKLVEEWSLYDRAAMAEIMK
ncbi:MAG: hypothetical protein RLZZ96_157 [Bacteroidota bacterium]|jgi:ketosteroid isomerase-like protein